MEIDEALAEHEEELLAAPGVVGVGIGQERGEDALVLLVERLVPGRDTLTALGLPSRLEGYLLVLREAGTIEAQ
jgi:hypothetical protein